MPPRSKQAEHGKKVMIFSSFWFVNYAEPDFGNRETFCPWAIAARLQHQFVWYLGVMLHTNNRFSVTLDSKLLKEAMKLTGAKSKRETIARAVEELVKREKRKGLAEAIGTGVFGTSEIQLKTRRHQKRGRAAH